MPLDEQHSWYFFVQQSNFTNVNKHNKYQMKILIIVVFRITRDSLVITMVIQATLVEKFFKKNRFIFYPVNKKRFKAS